MSCRKIAALYQRKDIFVFFLYMPWQPLQRNIINLYLIKISTWFMLFMPVVVPFYQSNGLGLSRLMIIQAVYSVTVVILEIPSGYLADVIGRRFALILGTSMTVIGFITYSCFHGFWGFLAAEMVLGIGASMVSGADSAILYDTLIEMDRQQQYMQYEGRVTSVGNFSEAIAGIFGGLLAEYVGIRSPYYIQIGISLIGVPAAIMLTEPMSHLSKPKMTFRDILGIVRYALIDVPLLRRNIMYASVIGASTLTMAWFVQPYFKQVHIPLEWYGILWTALNLTVALFSISAYKLEHKIGEVKIILLITFFIVSCYFMTGFIDSRWGLAFLFVFYMVRGIANPVLKDYINRLTPSEMRATVLSIRNFLIRILFACLGPILGWVSDFYSLRDALILAGGTFLLLGTVTLFLYLLLIRKGSKSL